MQQPPSNQSSSEPQGGALAELSSDAQQLGSSAADRVHSEVDARKGQAAEQVKSVSSAIEKTADQLDQSSPEWLKSAFRQGAAQVQRFADAIEHKDSRELMREAQQFARNNPGTFLAACAAAGFAAARVLKAGGEQKGGAGRGAQQRTQDTGQRASYREPQSAFFRGEDPGGSSRTRSLGEQG
jgi:ElaB/YqjD/DUF883 family membrane-anchored ribosome-binding protein